jgi:outer membrane immunogenic protein
MKKMMVEWAVTLALSSFAVAAACAAEMPVKARPPAAPPVPTWTGLYIGVNGGGVWGTTYPNFTIDDSQGNYFTFGAGQTANVVAVQGAGTSSWAWNICSSDSTDSARTHRPRLLSQRMVP